MTRHMLVVHNGKQVLVPQAEIPLEQHLHDLLTDHPQLLPLSDMGLGRSLVIAKEAPLSAGAADLILVDEEGELCIVEVKKEHNPDTRRVIAQLIDYAASLWKLSLEELDRNVFATTVGSAWASGLAEFLADNFESDEPIDIGSVSGGRVLQQLEANLETGDFLMAVAAPTISLNLRRAMEYQNERGSRIYGIEFSYFLSPDGTQCLLPQLVVAPPLRSQPAARDENRILDAAGDHRNLILKLIDVATSAGAESKPRADFISIVARKSQGAVTPLYLSPNAATIAIANPGGAFPDGPFTAASEGLQQGGLGTIGGSGMYRRVDYLRIPPGKEPELVKIVSDLCTALLGGSVTTDRI